MDITKGKPQSVKTKFKRRGVVATFVNPPTWVLYDENGKKLLNGVASNVGSDWIANFTVPTTYVVPNGKQELELEFTGYDNNNHSYVKSIDLTLKDDSNDFQPIGIVYNQLNNNPLRDSILVDYDEVDEIRWKLISPNPADPVIEEGVITSPTPKSSTSSGYLYKLNLGRPVIPTTVYNDPYMLIIDVVVDEDDADEDPINEMHPVYILDAKMSTLINQLTSYLDKAQLTEIDESLQWSTPEYMHFILEGVKHINSGGTEPSFWTTKDMPTMLRQYLFAASALYALNARYLAEGFNSFEFSGLNVQFNLDRRETITYKIEELRGYLDGLAAAKKSAISANGPGTPVGPEIDGRVRRVGILGLQASAVSNGRSRFGRSRYGRYGFY